MMKMTHRFEGSYAHNYISFISFFFQQCVASCLRESCSAARDRLGQVVANWDSGIKFPLSLPCNLHWVTIFVVCLFAIVLVNQCLPSYALASFLMQLAVLWSDYSKKVRGDVRRSRLKICEKVLLVFGDFLLCENRRFSPVFRFRAQDAYQMR